MGDCAGPQLGHRRSLLQRQLSEISEVLGVLGSSSEFFGVLGSSGISD
ncbi:hypothetical protein SNL152K_4369 [Streptomyces sp. NL15-2K]|nr:hypothetical protein SNL152K_4369 [Streptomyces sp. NL15-2K]